MAAPRKQSGRTRTRKKIDAAAEAEKQKRSPEVAESQPDQQKEIPPATAARAATGTGAKKRVGRTVDRRPRGNLASELALEGWLGEEGYGEPTPATGSRAKKSASKKKASSAKKADKPTGIDDSPMDIATALGYMPGLVGGSPRQTLPTNANILGNMPFAFIARRVYDQMDLTTLEPGTYSGQQLLELLADAWPEASQALWNIQRLASNGWKYRVNTPDGKREDAAGKAALDALMNRVNPNYGGFHALIAQWVMSVALQGACAGECVPNDTIDDVDEIVSVQPWSIFFQRGFDQRFIPFQWQPMKVAAAGNQAIQALQKAESLMADPTAKAPSSMSLIMSDALQHGGFRKLNEITFGYIPLDTDVDDPYGRAPFASVLQLVAWDAQMIKDLRQWSHVHSFGRIDVTVVAEKAQELMPPAIKNDALKRREWLRQYLTQLQQSYNALNPDDTFIHWDNVTVSANDPSGSTLDVDKLIRVIERRVFRGLKQLPILMGSNEGTTETWGSLQLEIYFKGIESIQRAVASLAQKLLTVALRILGFTSVVVFEFENLSASDRLKEAQAERLEIQNAAAMRDQGWITQDDASIRITGSKAVADPPDPDPFVAALQPDMAAEQHTPPPDTGQKPGSKPGESDEPDPNDPNDPGNAGKKGSGDEGKSPDQVLDAEQGDGKADAKKPAAKGDGKGSAKKGGSNQKGAPGSIGRPSSVQARSAGHTSAITAFWLSADDAARLAIPNGEEASELHITLTFHGEAAGIPDPQKLKDAIAGVAGRFGPITGRVSGFGRFQNGDSHAIYASVDSAQIGDFRAELADAIRDQAGVDLSTEHGFTPHITLAYVGPDDETPIDSVPSVDLTFREVTLAMGAEHTRFDLSADDEADRALIAQALQRALADTVAARAAAKKGASGHVPSAKRKAQARAMQTAVGAWFRSKKVSEHLIDHIISTHRNMATANNRQTHPDLQDAVRVICNMVGSPVPEGVDPLQVRLTEQQRQLLLASIAKQLEPEFGDYDDDLKSLIYGYRLQAYEIGGQEGLDEIGKGKHTFSLSNTDLLAAMATYAVGRVSTLQQTTRNQLAYTIAQGLVNGDTDAAIRSAVHERLSGMADSRADLIASTEESDGYHAGKLETWQRNGVPMKVWVTGGDPDPDAGATGETPCRDNSYAGAVPLYESFPSGDWAPPAHGRCICGLAASGDPGDYADAEPWVGD